MATRAKAPVVECLPDQQVYEVTITEQIVIRLSAQDKDEALLKAARVQLWATEDKETRGYTIAFGPQEIEVREVI